MTALDKRARKAADDLAYHLRDPQTVVPLLTDSPMAHSLAYGAAGVALLHIERAHVGLGSWRTATRWVEYAMHGYASNTTAGLHTGALPGLGFVAHAAAGGSVRLKYVRDQLRSDVVAITRVRLDRARTRLSADEAPAPVDFGLADGLAGLGAYFLVCDPEHPVLCDIAAYFADVGRRLRHHSEAPLPCGMAEGIAGPVALLSLLVRSKIVAPKHEDAIADLSGWLEARREDLGCVPTWPQPAGTSADQQHSAAEWAAGSTGIARALQLAGLALHDEALQHRAEDVLLASLTGPVHRALLADTTIAHGWAGALQTVWRAAQDAGTPALRTLAKTLTSLSLARALDESRAGLLDGDAGTALVLHAVAGNTPSTRWDTCLLLH